MTQKRVTLILLMLGLMVSGLSLHAQSDDPVLFTVADKPVRVSEFKYIYSKTNGAEANFSRESLDEYLDLYVKFKLKVQKARDMQLDTIEQLQQELEGYRRQLADSYLINKEVTERLVREAYDRSKQDIDLNHIVFSVPPNAPPSDTMAAYKMALEVKDRLVKGGDFTELAKQYSGDPSVQQNGGHIGYVNVLFPQGFYEMEKTAYELPLNTISDPVRTPAGYHLIKITGKRPARGEMEGAHILIRNSEPNAKAKADDIYQQLENGANFEELARNNSGDSRTAQQGGYIGFFGINQFEPAFENAAFGIEQDGAYTEPVQSSVGWHIIKRISKKGVEPYDQARGRLEAQIKKDPRYEAAQIAMIQQIQKDADFTEYRPVLEQFKTTQNDTLFTFRWQAPAKPSKEVLFTLADNRYTVGDFAAYLARNTRKRMQLGRNTPIGDGIEQLYQEFVKESTLRHEEQQLEDKYPEFKALMREYREGILLFEVTKMKVWDKASEDTTGLREFFKDVKGKYRWNTRAIVSEYTVSMANKNQLNALREYAAGHGPDEVRERFGTALSGFREMTIEQGKSPEAASLDSWEANSLTTTKLDRPKNQYSFMKIEEILPPADKKLEEARGYVIADYQDKLEKEWVAGLREQYEVSVNEKVLESLVRGQ
jgi:peptidyl-prolyl cis-trans isomerase SurA